MMMKSNQPFIDEIRKLASENKKLLKAVKLLTAQRDDWKKKYEDAISLPSTALTLEKFRHNYLKLEFNEDTMPSSGGIYAYFNNKTEQLYIGQSVNMKNRLKQHFRNGKIKIEGHDSEFNGTDDWSFYVLEYIDRDNKAKLNEREAYWIAIGREAVNNKVIVNKKSIVEMETRLKNGKPISGLTVSKEVETPGQLTNRTRGNNVKM